MHDVSPGVQPSMTEAIRVVRPAGRFERNGLALRSEPFLKTLDLLKENLHWVSVKAKVPELHRNAGLAILCEAVSNWHRHNQTGDLVYIFSARPTLIEQVYRYQSAVFDTHPPLPETPSAGGYGLTVIRGLCSADASTDEVPHDSPNVRFNFSRGWVTVRLIRRW